MTPEFGEHAVIAGILGIAVALVRVIEKLIDKLLEKKNGKNGVHRQIVVQLDPEASKAIRETNGYVGDIHKITFRTDPDGSLLVYGPRHEVKSIRETVDKIEERVEDILRIEEYKKG